MGRPAPRVGNGEDRPRSSDGELCGLGAKVGRALPATSTNTSGEDESRAGDQRSGTSARAEVIALVRLRIDAVRAGPFTVRDAERSTHYHRTSSPRGLDQTAGGSTRCGDRGRVGECVAEHRQRRGAAAAPATRSPYGRCRSRSAGAVTSVVVTTWSSTPRARRCPRAAGTRGPVAVDGSKAGRGRTVPCRSRDLGREALARR